MPRLRVDDLDSAPKASGNPLGLEPGLSWEPIYLYMYTYIYIYICMYTFVFFCFPVALRNEGFGFWEAAEELRSRSRAEGQKKGSSRLRLGFRV